MIKKVQEKIKNLLLVTLLFSAVICFAQPTATSATGVTSGSFTATWESVTGATGYYLDVSESSTFGSGTVASNLIISEYGEGNGGYKKYLEIFNGTGAAVDLSNYELWRISNGGDWPEAELPLSGMLADGATYSVSYNNTDVYGADITSNTFMSQNGDDALGLAWNGGSGTVFNLIDAVGTDGADPGTAWTVAGVSNATKDHILIRKSSVFDPTTDWVTAAGTNATDSEWIVSSFTYDNVTQTTDLGSHTFDGGFTPSFVTGYDGLDVGNITSYEVTDLEPGTTYYFRVRSYDGTTTSDNSNVITVVTTTCGLVDLPTADSQSLCPSVATVANLTVTTGENIQWYDAATGGTALAPETVLITGTYYASQMVGSCESDRVAVSVTVTAIDAPTADAQEFCGLTTVAELTVTTGENIQWYDVENDGIPLATNTELVTGTYYVSQTVGDCESTRTAVSVTINEAPVAPTADSFTTCGSATVADLTAEGTNIAETIFEDTFEDLSNWNAINVNGSTVWDISSSGSPVNAPFAAINGYQEDNEDWLVSNAIAIPSNVIEATFSFDSAYKYNGPDLEVYYTTNYTGDVATTSWQLLSPEFSSLGNYDWANSGDLDVSDAIGSDLVIAFKYTSENGVDTAKSWDVDNVQVTTQHQNINWYDVATGGTALTDDTALATGSYYVSQIVNGCESARTEVAVTVNPIPSAPTADAQLFCGSATAAELVATVEGAAIWYADATTTTTLPTDTVLATGSYYVSQIVNGCESARTEVAVTVTEVAMPVGEATQEFTDGETIADLDVTGDNIVWYSDAELTTVVDATTALVDEATYYAVANNGDCASEALAVTAEEVLNTPVITNAKFTHYPNPVNDILNIEFKENITSVTVYNLIGQLVLERNTDTNNVHLNMSTLSAGTYIVRAASGSKTTSFKVVKN